MTACQMERETLLLILTAVSPPPFPKFSFIAVLVFAIGILVIWMDDLTDVVFGTLGVSRTYRIPCDVFCYDPSQKATLYESDKRLRIVHKSGAFLFLVFRFIETNNVDAAGASTSPKLARRQRSTRKRSRCSNR